MSSERYGGLRDSGNPTLWAHLMRNEPSGSNVNATMSQLPPITPQDKNATTMRVLLHDTQMNLEKFSEHVATLLSNVKETKQEILTTSTLFEQEHDKLLGDIVDLVNRTQTQIQKSIGSPAQATTLETFMAKMELRLESLDQRLDALQAV
ncbi:hypothetical protein FA15DRAFT_639042 [Coprinopsis marcescibilis]|uniref:Uncharacterized protein n=1 Tax=Coprinopsis marcescibilis TaxID=230819 RepID=A0A5C3KYD4_COPMA|nr:hypothetical protein FA15DRAFT_639042 [Coprinopsis marcescibilis]